MRVLAGRDAARRQVLIGLRSGKAAAALSKACGDEALGAQLETALFKQYSATNTEYRQHFRALLRLLKDEAGAAERVQQLRKGKLKISKAVHLAYEQSALKVLREEARAASKQQQAEAKGAPAGEDDKQKRLEQEEADADDRRTKAIIA
jgi:hypothetical protein